MTLISPTFGIDIDLSTLTGIDTLIDTGNTDTLSNVTSVDVTGADDGTVNGSIAFTNFENLTGTGSADAFIISTGTLSGAIDGGAGADTLGGAAIVDLSLSSAADSDGYSILYKGEYVTNMTSEYKGDDLIVSAPDLAKKFRLKNYKTNFDNRIRKVDRY